MNELSPNKNIDRSKILIAVLSVGIILIAIGTMVFYFNQNGLKTQTENPSLNAASQTADQTTAESFLPIPNPNEVKPETTPNIELTNKNISASSTSDPKKAETKQTEVKTPKNDIQTPAKTPSSTSTTKSTTPEPAPSQKSTTPISTPKPDQDQGSLDF